MKQKYYDIIITTTFLLIILTGLISINSLLLNGIITQTELINQIGGAFTFIVIIIAFIYILR